MKKYDSFYLSEAQIEELKRKKKWNKKMTKSAVIMLTALSSLIIGGFVPSFGLGAALTAGIQHVLKGVHLFGTIAGVCTFAGALHDPLTPEEAKELADRETIDKVGRSK